MFISITNTILFLMSTYVYELSLHETPPSWLQWSLASHHTASFFQIKGTGTPRSKLLLPERKLVNFKGLLSAICHYRILKWVLQWLFLCIISLVVDIADYMVSEMRALILALLRTFHIQFFGDTSAHSTDSTGTQINTHTNTHMHPNSPAPSHKISVFKAPYSTTLSITRIITSLMDEWMRMEQR